MFEEDIKNRFERKSFHLKFAVNIMQFHAIIIINLFRIV